VISAAPVNQWKLRAKPGEENLGGSFGGKLRRKTAEENLGRVTAAGLAVGRPAVLTIDIEV